MYIHIYIYIYCYGPIYIYMYIFVLPFIVAFYCFVSLARISCLLIMFIHFAPNIKRAFCPKHSTSRNDISSDDGSGGARVTP